IFDRLHSILALDLRSRSGRQQREPVASSLPPFGPEAEGRLPSSRMPSVAEQEGNSKRSATHISAHDFYSLSDSKGHFEEEPRAGGVLVRHAGGVGAGAGPRAAGAAWATSCGADTPAPCTPVGDCSSRASATRRAAACCTCCTCTCPARRTPSRCRGAVRCAP